MFDISSLAQSYENIFLGFLFEYKLEFFGIFVMVFVGRRLYRAVKGGKYTSMGLILSPLLYLLFTSFTFIGLGLLGLMICSVAFAFGLALSGILKGQLHFFEKQGQLYYKRSITIVVGWTVAFVLRLYLFIFFDITVGLILSLILSYISGLIIGEAFQIAVQKRIFDVNKAHAEELLRQESETDVL